MKGSKMRPKDIPSGHDYCKDCDQFKPIEEFPKTPGAYCRKCLNIRTKNAPNYQKNVRSNHLQKKYGITIEQYDELSRQQQGVCAICSEPETSKGKSQLSVDHDHKTGMVRGLLCHNCNTGLGKFMDNRLILQSAIFYLDKTQGQIDNKIRQILIKQMEDK
jgi:hypothetical protein